MDVFELFRSFQTQEKAIEYLEKVRWHGRPICPYCESDSVSRHASGDRKQHRWQCQSCARAFAATVGTVFHGTHVELSKWFMLLFLVLKLKNKTSSYQIALELGMRRPTVWRMMHRIRLAVDNDPQQSELLHSLIEAKETYVGDGSNKNNIHDNDTYGSKRARSLGKNRQNNQAKIKSIDFRKISVKYINRIWHLVVTMDATSFFFASLAVLTVRS